MTAYLVVDTNSLPIEGNLQSGFWNALFRLCALKGIQPAICEVTFDEAVNLRKDRANAVIEAFVASQTRLSRMTTVSSVYTPSGDEVAQVYARRLLEVFEVLALDGEHAREAFRREALRILPARVGKGGRDSAIWLTVAALANAGHELYFVTKNSKDFGSGGLFVELLEEVAGATHPVRYFASPNDFIDSIASQVNLPAIPDAEVANAFWVSIRTEIVLLFEDVESTEYTVDRAWNSEVAASDVHLGAGYEIDGQVFTRARARIVISDAGGGEWAEAKMDGWLNLEPGTFAARASDVDHILDLDLRGHPPA
jgi:hypothetical protein